MGAWPGVPAPRLPPGGANLAVDWSTTGRKRRCDRAAPRWRLEAMAATAVETGGGPVAWQRRRRRLRRPDRGGGGCGSRRQQGAATQARGSRRAAPVATAAAGGW